VAHLDFWLAMRELRASLTAAGETAWSQRLRAALAPASRRRAPTPEVAACLRDLQASGVPRRLDLERQVARLLAWVDPQEG
jgi:hypothetical protein